MDFLGFFSGIFLLEFVCLGCSSPEYAPGVTLAILFYCMAWNMFDSLICWCMYSFVRLVSSGLGFLGIAVPVDWPFITFGRVRVRVNALVCLGYSLGSGSVGSCPVTPNKEYMSSMLDVSSSIPRIAFGLFHTFGRVRVNPLEFYYFFAHYHRLPRSCIRVYLYLML